jgi:WD40 repeat protein
MKPLAAPLVLALAACGGHGSGDVSTISSPQGALWGARFSPAGDVLSIAYGEEEKIGTIDLDAGSLRELSPGGTYLSGTAWSPAGDYVYYNGVDGIGRISTDIAQNTMINTSLATLGIDVSPDGKQLAYGVNGGDARLYTLATMAEESLGQPCAAIRFAPTGDRVACISGGALVVIDLPTREVTTVIDRGLPSLAGVDWYASGLQLLFTSQDGIERIGIDGNDRHLVAGAFAAVEVDLSADDQSIVFGENGQDALTLVRL